MTSWELFNRQGQEYREKVLPPVMRARVAVEADRGLGWRECVGSKRARCRRTMTLVPRHPSKTYLRISVSPRAGRT
jgi:transketolase